MNIIELFTFLSALLESDLEVCVWADSGPLTVPEAWSWFWVSSLALLMCSTCRAWPCMLLPFSSLTAASADWAPLIITMATLQNKEGHVTLTAIWETNCCKNIFTYLTDEGLMNTLQVVIYSLFLAFLVYFKCGVNTSLYYF